MAERTFGPVEEDDRSRPSSLDPGEETIGVKAVTAIDDHHGTLWQWIETKGALVLCPARDLGAD